MNAAERAFLHLDHFESSVAEMSTNPTAKVMLGGRGVADGLEKALTEAAEDDPTNTHWTVALKILEVARQAPNQGEALGLAAALTTIGRTLKEMR